MLMVSTTGEQHAFYRLDENLAPSRGGAARKPARIGRAHPRELRAGALLGAVHGGRRRLAARRRHGKPGAADALGAPGADDGDRGRRAGVRLAGRRHHLHGRRHAAAGKLLRLRADAGARRADRIHFAPRRLRRARRPCRRGAAARRGRRPARRAAEQCVRERSGLARSLARGARHESAAAAATSCRRPSASPRRTDRPHHRSLWRDERGRSGLRRGWRRFATVLDELCAELPLLRADPTRRPSAAGRRRAPDGGGGRAVPRTALRHADGGGRGRRGRRGPRGDDARGGGSPAPMSTTAATSRFILGLRRDVLDRHGRSPGPAEPVRPRHDRAADRVRGVATSGWRGRSFSLGVADAVTVLADSRRARRRRGDADRQRGGHSRPSRDQACASPRPRSSKRSRRSARHCRRRPLSRRRNRSRARRGCGRG